MISTWGIPITAKYVYKINKFDVYGGLGLGYYSSKLRTSYETSGGLTISDSENKTDYGIGYHAVVGGDYKITQLLAVNAEVKWSTVPLKFYDKNTDVGGWTPSVGLKFMF